MHNQPVVEDMAKQPIKNEIKHLTGEVGVI